MLRNARVLSTAALVLASVAAAVAAEQKASFTDPAKAGPDFAVQGEYAGEIQSELGPVKMGVQVVALGEGKFHVVGYVGGLPGAGWNGQEKHEANGETKDGVAVFKVPDADAQAAIKDGAMTITVEGKVVGKLAKTSRQSPTLGQKPPAGAVVLFDGATPENFKDGRMTEDGLLMEGATSKRLFQSFTAHLEFREPFEPAARGQGRGNSGFYAQGRYEVQILDSFGLEPRDNECGGIYGVSKPLVNMSLPPLSWQTYDVDYTAAEYKDGKKVANARITVRHNGELIQKDVELPHGTTAHPVAEGPEPGPIYLQNHGNPVRFRNIWVVEKK
jgi:hypothetical protein